MSCPITSGITALDCLDGKGGNEALYVTEVENLNTITVDATGLITAITLDTGKQFWEIKCEKEDIQAMVTETTNATNGTTSYVHQVTYSSNKLSVTKRQFFKLLSLNRLMVMVKDNNGQYMLYGRTGGYTSYAADTGKAYADKNGYTATFTSNEPEDKLYVTGALVPSLLTPAP